MNEVGCICTTCKTEISVLVSCLSFSSVVPCSSFGVACFGTGSTSTCMYQVVITFLSLPPSRFHFLPFFLRCYDLASDSHFSILDREWNNQIVKIWHYCNFVVEENLQMKIDFRCLCTSLSNAFASAVCLRSLSLVALHIYFEQ